MQIYTSSPAFEQTQAHSGLTPRAFWVLAAAWTLAFDFKGDAGGNWWIFLISGLCAAILLGQILFYGIQLSHSRQNFIFVSGLFLPVIWSVFPLAFGDLQVGNFFRTSFPIVLGCLGYLTCAGLTIEERIALCKKLPAAALVAAVFGVIAGLTITGASLLEIRYQILSPMLSLLFAGGMAHLLSRDGSRLFSIGALGTVLVLGFLSATRGFLLAVVFAAAVTILCSDNKATKLRALLAALVMGVAALAAAQVFAPEILERWFDRVLYSGELLGVDPTTLTRLAEIEDQTHQLTASIFNFIFGLGLGGEYFWSGDYLELLGPYVLRDQFEQANFYVGHNFFIYSVFASGVIIGLALPIALIYSLWVAIKIAVKRDYDFLENQFLKSMILAFLLFTVAYTISGNPFGPRSSSLLIGFVFGLLTPPQTVRGVS